MNSADIATAVKTGALARPLHHPTRLANEVAAVRPRRFLSTKEYDAIWAALRLLGEKIDLDEVPCDIDAIRTSSDSHDGLTAEECQTLADEFADHGTLQFVEG